MRPTGPETKFIQIDDVDDAALLKLCAISHLNLRISAGNHQAWVAVTGERSAQEAKELARRLRKGTSADMSASGATRLAGSTNYKLKYAPNFPQVTLMSAFPGRMTTPGQLEEMGLLAAPEPQVVRVAALRVPNSGTCRTWPEYARCVQGAPPTNDKSGPDISRADFTWALMALLRGHTIEDTASRLLELSSKALENGGGYALRTAQECRGGGGTGERTAEKPGVIFSMSVRDRDEASLGT